MHYVLFFFCTCSKSAVGNIAGGEIHKPVLQILNKYRPPDSNYLAPGTFLAPKKLGWPLDDVKDFVNREASTSEGSHGDVP